MQSRVNRIHFRNHVFDVPEDVYEPAEDSFLFAENLEVKEGAQVLDLGTGCGILGILAAEKAKEVFAIDLNPYALRCAKENSAFNNAESKIVFLQADLFTAFNIDARFDLILFNAPYLPADNCETQTWIGRSWAGGVNGRQVIDRFISQVVPHLKADGRVLMVQSTLANVEETIFKFSENHLAASVKAEQSLPFFETLVLIEAKA